MYEKLAGTTGTSVTEADDIVDIYNLEVLEVPSNIPMIHIDTDDQHGRNSDNRIRQELKDVSNESGERDARAAEIREQVERLKQKALGAGGLFVLGTERHESRRIDNQLRGRSGRQGDPGHSK